MSVRARIVIADPHELIIEGLRALLQGDPELMLVGSATTSAALFAELEAHQPDVAAVEFGMPMPGGGNCPAIVRRRWPTMRVLMLCASAEPECVRAALDMGVDGMALKIAPARYTIEALRQVAHGNMVFPSTARRFMHEQRDPGPQLSGREQEVLALIATGQPNSQIALALHLSENTVKFHLQNIFQKLGVSNRTEAAAHYKVRA